MAFSNYLIKIGENASSLTKIPLKYIQAKSYKVTPNRRQDLDPYRDANGQLHRNTLSHKPSTITFSTTPMWNDDMAALMSLIRSSYAIAKERKVYLDYFCPDTNGYNTGWFYVPDIEYNIDLVDTKKSRLFYYPSTIEFIEY